MEAGGVCINKYNEPLLLGRLKVPIVDYNSWGF